MYKYIILYLHLYYIIFTFILYLHILNYIYKYVCEINKTNNTTISDPTLESSLFGVVTLTKDVNNDRHKYSGYGIGFDRKGRFSFSDIELGRNVIIFGADTSSSTKIDNKKKDTLILGEGSIQGLEHTLSAEKMYSINFTEKIKKFV